MRVLHLNVRLSEGGAARVARELHTRLLEQGIESKFFYGYGPGAKSSPQEDAVPQAFRVGRRDQVAANYFAHGLVGVDFFAPIGRRAASLKTAIREAAVVHLHDIHSHFVPYTWLLRQLRDSNKKIVWTLHNRWVLTGRCALPADCERWRSGCGNCPSMTNYPSARIDLSASESKRKRNEIASLRGNLVLVGCSRQLSQAAKSVFPNHEVRLVQNGLDADMEEQLRALPRARGPLVRKGKLLIIGADLSDSRKQDIPLLRRIIECAGSTVHVVGKHSVFSGKNVVNHGPISSRARLAELYRGVDATLFTSRVDAFSLVMLESLSAGTPVLALECPGNSEVLELVDARPVITETEMLDRVRQGSFSDLYRQRTRRELQEKALAVFTGRRMVERYANIYRSLLGHAAA